MVSESGASITHVFQRWLETDLEWVVSEKNLVWASGEAWSALRSAGVPPSPLPELGHLQPSLSLLSKHWERPVTGQKLNENMSVNYLPSNSLLLGRSLSKPTSPVGPHPAQGTVSAAQTHCACPLFCPAYLLHMRL